MKWHDRLICSLLYHPKNKGAVTYSCLHTMPMCQFRRHLEYLDIQDELESEWHRIQEAEAKAQRNSK